jgi:hypothetical protein
MESVLKNSAFVVATIGNLWISRSTLHNIHHHGFYRFFSREIIIILFLLNVEDWFLDPFSPVQIFSWTFLLVLLFLILQGVRSFRHKGNIDQDRKAPVLVAIEKTTTLITTGIYHLI